MKKVILSTILLINNVFAIDLYAIKNGGENYVCLL